jgi:hypothetical protein
MAADGQTNWLSLRQIDAQVRLARAGSHQGTTYMEGERILRLTAPMAIAVASLACSATASNPASPSATGNLSSWIDWSTPVLN